MGAAEELLEVKVEGARSELGGASPAVAVEHAVKFVVFLERSEAEVRGRQAGRQAIRQAGGRQERRKERTQVGRQTDRH